MFRRMADIYNYRVDAWQRRFMGELFNAVFSLRGRVNFTNLARFSRLHEQTFLAIWDRLRHFKKAFQWVWFNLIVFRLRQHPEEPIIGAFDCTFAEERNRNVGAGTVLFIAGGKAEEGPGGVGSRNRRDFKPPRLRSRRYSNAFRSPNGRRRGILSR